MSLFDKLARLAGRSAKPLRVEPVQRPASASPLPATARPVASRPPRGFANLPGSDRDALARIGAAVRGRLDAAPGAAKLPATGLDIYAFANFLSAAECADLIALIDADVRPSTSLRPGNVKANRTSETCRLDPADMLVAAVEQRIAALLGVPLMQSETIQGQRYIAGQRFTMHNDYFAGGQRYSAVVASEGGQRSWTAMIYLDKPEGGGATVFPHAGVSVTPRPGALLTWDNMDRSGDPNGYAHHEGAPVTTGVKHVLTKWFRERPWHGSEASDALRAAK